MIILKLALGLPKGEVKILFGPVSEGVTLTFNVS